ncbi:MAG: DUF2911 domain-containing protein [Fluviicola sp.]|nr:DUF2911 domain-containing protein [Fluviicola sp.]
MKSIAIALFLFATVSVNAQIKTPRLSPNAEIEQKVGLTKVKITYSRPSKRERVIFGDVVPFNEVWRTGANENTIVKFSNAVIFGSDTLAKGEYSLYTLPNTEGWKVYFYKTTNNWGNPQEWKEDLIVLEVEANLTALNDEVETFTISIDNITTKSAVLSFSWDKTKASVAFTVPTGKIVEAAIKKVMAGPSANDYFNSADYLFSEKKELKKALGWVSKAIEMRGQEAFWMMSLKAKIQAELKDYSGAIESAKLAITAAETAGYDNYAEENKTAIEKWSKLK